jgi:uncharacterized membrane protein
LKKLPIFVGWASWRKVNWFEANQPRIAKFARAVGADLVVVGHRRRNFLELVVGGSGGYIVDNVDCSLLVAQTTISDTAFEAELRELDAALV